MATTKRPRAWLDEDQPWCPALTVYEAPEEAIDTGLLDAGGTKIFRQPQRASIGFDLRSGKAR